MQHLSTAVVTVEVLLDVNEMFLGFFFFSWESAAVKSESVVEPCCTKAFSELMLDSHELELELIKLRPLSLF